MSRILAKGYRRIILGNLLRRAVYGKKENKFLFILSPPFCGSTLLHELISTSSHVSANHVIGTREGQTLPTVRQIMFDHHERWDEKKKYPWDMIKKEWLRYWDVTKPVLIEKSPPNIIRAMDIEGVFKPAYFICIVRDPYAHSEGLIRRSGMLPAQAAQFSITCLRHQKNNINCLKKIIYFRYEDLVTFPDCVKEKIVEFIPELEDINLNHTFNVHNFKDLPMKLTNLNEEKISKLTREQLDAINTVFVTDREIIEYFDYKIMSN